MTTELPEHNKINYNVFRVKRLRYFINIIVMDKIPEYGFIFRFNYFKNKDKRPIYVRDFSIFKTFFQMLAELK